MSKSYERHLIRVSDRNREEKILTAERGLITRNIEPVIFEAGDGDSFFVMGRMLVGIDAKRFNANNGDLLLMVQYGGNWAVMPIVTGRTPLIGTFEKPFLHPSYVREKLEDKVNLRHQMAFYNIACFVAHREHSGADEWTPEFMGWDDDWERQLGVFKENAMAWKEDFLASGMLSGV